MRPPEILPFTDAAVDDAAELLAARHRAHRAAEPLLTARYEEPAAARAEIEALLARDGASGAVARAGGRTVGFLLGTPRPEEMWGPNVWVEAAGHAVAAAEKVRDLYAVAATGWVAAGQTYHYALVPASDTALVDAWFRLGFGQQHVHALRESAPGSVPSSGAGVTVRRATADDLDALAELDRLLPEHQALAPVFAAGHLPTPAEARADWAENLAEPAAGVFVAEVAGCVVGSAFGCPIEASRAHSSVARPDGAGLLAFAAVRPEARGYGVGRLLGEAVAAWCAEVGLPIVVTDWRETNLLSSRAWPALGFRRTFLRLHRRV